MGFSSQGLLEHESSIGRGSRPACDSFPGWDVHANKAPSLWSWLSGVWGQDDWASLFPSFLLRVLLV